MGVSEALTMLAELTIIRMIEQTTFIAEFRRTLVVFGMLEYQ